jgi:hypothetical protein
VLLVAATATRHSRSEPMFSVFGQQFAMPSHHRIACARQPPRET